MIVRDDKLSCRKLLVSFHNEKVVGFARNTVVRDKRDPKSDTCKVNEQVIAAQLNFRHEVKLVLLKQTVEEFACRTFAVQHQDRVLEQLFERELAALQLTERFVCDKHIFKIFNLFDSSQTAEVAVRIIGHDQIYLSGLKQFDALDRSLVCHFDMRVRKFFVEPLQIRDKKIAADRVACTDADLSSGCSRIHQLRLSALDQIHCRLHMAQQNLSFRGELDALRTPDKERLVQLLFQSLDGLAHCGLRDKELLGCLRN